MVTKGRQVQFIPYNGVYVVARQNKGKTVLTILNGKRTENTLSVNRYAEVIGSASTATDVITGDKVDISKDVVLPARAAIILEF